MELAEEKRLRKNAQSRVSRGKKRKYETLVDSFVDEYKKLPRANAYLYLLELDKFADTAHKQGDSCCPCLCAVSEKVANARVNLSSIERSNEIYLNANLGKKEIKRRKSIVYRKTKSTKLTQKECFLEALALHGIFPTKKYNEIKKARMRAYKTDNN
eukprot:snap_masked-scaffold_34-processed-gene-3.49-mRNA-1 protein AED:1.00 eAED:1.00 QI:0/-1/0/0/-1/1/1/0/156